MLTWLCVFLRALCNMIVCTFGLSQILFLGVVYYVSLHTSLCVYIRIHTYHCQTFPTDTYTCFRHQPVRFTRVVRDEMYLAEGQMQTLRVHVSCRVKFNTHICRIMSKSQCFVYNAHVIRTDGGPCGQHCVAQVPRG